jgi:prepilin-type N-terminal cleavage/methylation domain-containing protein
MRKSSGFTLIELMIVVAIIAIIAAIALPGLLGSRKAANEQAAVGSLKAVANAQQTFQTKRYVDQDLDGTGEYGFLQELTGVAGNVRNDGGTEAGGPIIGEILAQALGTLDVNGIASKGGYLFHMYLPTDDTVAGGDAVAEPQVLPAGVAANSDAQEARWCCYAWPVNRGNTGDRAFVINHQGNVYETDNKVQLYSSAAVAPTANAAFVPGTLNVNGALAAGAAGVDGGIWVGSGG